MFHIDSVISSSCEQDDQIISCHSVRPNMASTAPMPESRGSPGIGFTVPLAPPVVVRPRPLLAAPACSRSERRTYTCPNLTGSRALVCPRHLLEQQTRDHDTGGVDMYGTTPDHGHPFALAQASRSVALIYMASGCHIVCLYCADSSYCGCARTHARVLSRGGLGKGPHTSAYAMGSRAPAPTAAPPGARRQRHA
jgi:hypothetical protein